MYIQSINLENGDTLQPGDFNVIIGGNAVGKTTFLVELFARVCGSNRPRWYWVRAIEHKSREPRRDAELLVGSLVRQWEGATVYYYSQSVKSLDGSVDLDGALRFTEAERDQLEQLSKGSKLNLEFDTFLSQPKGRRPFVSFLNCETRLNLPNQANMISFDRAPQDPLNVLYRNRRLLTEISSSISSQFNRKLVLLDHRGTVLDFGLTSGSPPPFNHGAQDLQAEFNQVESWKSQHFVPLQEIGHGIRSMLRILVSMLDPVHEAILIDEPEMHLYPAQKRWLGRQLVEFARKQAKQVFLVTHDPIVLQGILDSPAQSTILRVDFGVHDNRFIKPCALEHMTDVGARRNQDSYLQGLFYQRCIAVEGASDRAFYQTMVEDGYPETSATDLGLVACGGKGATKNVAHIAAKVGLRCAVIYDFDALLKDFAVVEDVFTLFGGDKTELQTLKELLLQSCSAGHDKEMAKRGMKSAFASRYHAVFEKALKALQAKGVFVVPNGDLESWAPSVESKVRFAELAPDIIKADQSLNTSFRDFMGRILEYLGCIKQASGDEYF